MSNDTNNTENPVPSEQKKNMEQRMRECELALSQAERELRGANSARFQILARIEEIKHDIAFITEHMAFSDMLEPYDFSRPIGYRDYSDDMTTSNGQVPVGGNGLGGDGGND